jgi:hypothetical protein
MTPSEMLELEVSLLLVRHGKQSVLKAIARRMRLSDFELETDLRKLSDASYALAAKKKSRGKPFLLAPLLIGRAEKADTLRLLQARFENRTFLPELKDVKRFFDRYEKHTPTFKSRLSAQTPLFKVLADVDLATLKKLLTESPLGVTHSSLGIISDEILGRGKHEK